MFPNARRHLCVDGIIALSHPIHPRILDSSHNDTGTSETGVWLSSSAHPSVLGHVAVYGWASAGVSFGGCSGCCFVDAGYGEFGVVFWWILVRGEGVQERKARERGGTICWDETK